MVLEQRIIPKLNEKISPLGFGVMRLPMQCGGFPEKVYRLMDLAVASGINYFDMGYTYQNGKAEELVKEAIVKKHPRESFVIATKMPLWEVHSKFDLDRIFNEQLERLGVDYIDFYLAHLVTSSSWHAMRQFDIKGFFREKKEKGLIRHVGFSFHDTPQVLETVISDFAWDFVQLQINYLDWHIRKANELYEIAEKHNLPIMVMEPLVGGLLSNLPKEAEEKFKQVHKDWSMSSWGIRFAASLPNVAITLSGMNEISQLTDNIKTISSLEPLGEEEQKAISDVVDLFGRRKAIPCSVCGYCLEVCPKHVQIPGLLQAYNEAKLLQIEEIFWARYDSILAGGPRAEACIECHACENRCPQKISITRYMKKISKMNKDRIILQEFKLDIFQLKSRLKSQDFIVCFGAGNDGPLIRDYILENGITNELFFTCNTSSKWEKRIGETLVIAPDKIREMQDGSSRKAFIIISTRKYRDEVRKQLQDMDLIENVLN